MMNTSHDEAKKNPETINEVIAGHYIRVGNITRPITKEMLTSALFSDGEQRDSINLKQILSVVRDCDKRTKIIDWLWEQTNDHDVQARMRLLKLTRECVQVTYGKLHRGKFIYFPISLQSIRLGNCAMLFR